MVLNGQSYLKKRLLLQSFETKTSRMSYIDGLSETLSKFLFDQYNFLYQYIWVVTTDTNLTDLICFKTAWRDIDLQRADSVSGNFVIKGLFELRIHEC